MSDDPYQPPGERDDDADNWFTRIPRGYFPRFAWWKWAIVMVFLMAILLVFWVGVVGTFG